MNPKREAKWHTVQQVVRYTAFEKRLNERSKSTSHYWTLALVAGVVLTAVMLASKYKEDSPIEPVPCHEPTGATP